ncbi:MAG: M20/M25/M40 family metallo-hydrolase [Clostridia bacterium]|nr:M20/M25/M40 family metallo-hydrolase [Clostridia bacterium]
MSCQKICETIDELYPEYLKIWESACNIESPTMDKKRVDEMGNFFLDIGKKHGWDTEVCESETGNVVCLTMNPTAKKEMISLSGHMDTVHPVGVFGYPPVRMDETNIYGPGVVDCKGGIIVGLLTMAGLEKAGYTDRPVRLLIQSDEESGSGKATQKTINYICQKAQGSRAFFNLEGAIENSVCVQRKGILTYTVKITGIEAHSSLCAQQGANAVAEAAHKILELEKFKNHDGITCACCVIHGGKGHNTLAGNCEFVANFRFTTEEQRQFIATYMQKLESTVYVDGCKTQVIQKGFRPAMERVQRNIELADTINKIFEENGFSKLKPVFKLGGSDAAQVTIAGIPCLDNLGVKGGNGHTLYEFAVKESLKEGAKRLATVIYNI